MSEMVGRQPGPSNGYSLARDECGPVAIVCAECGRRLLGNAHPAVVLADHVASGSGGVSLCRTGVERSERRERLAAGRER